LPAVGGEAAAQVPHKFLNDTATGRDWEYYIDSISSIGAGCRPVEFVDAGFDSERLQNHGHRTPIGERGLEQVQADKCGEEVPVGMNPVA
jgi:hypothetical protein